MRRRREGILDFQISILDFVRITRTRPSPYRPAEAPGSGELPDPYLPIQNPQSEIRSQGQLQWTRVPSAPRGNASAEADPITVPNQCRKYAFCIARAASATSAWIRWR